MKGGLMGVAAGAGEAPEAMPDEAADVGEAPASPEEEAQFEQLQELVTGLIHQHSRDKVMQELRAGRDDLATAIGQLASRLLSGIEQAVESKGGTIADAVRMEVGGEIVEQLIEICVAAGWVEEDEAAVGELFEQAMMAGLNAHGDATAQRRGIDRGQAMQQFRQQLAGAGIKETELAAAIRGA